jgi:hypothetical protein
VSDVSEGAFEMNAILRILIGAGVVASVWFAAFAIEATTRLMASLFVQFGADLPSPTMLTIDAVRNHVPWIVAAASTAAILFLLVRGSGYLLHACAAVAGMVAVLASCATLALALPLMKCGFSWPDWPPAMAYSSKRGTAPNVALNADTPKDSSAVSCR